jgi:hypothetical protein
LPGLDLGLTSKVQADRGGYSVFTIGKLARIADVSSDTLRYYEREGLIEPAGKSPAGYRLYGYLAQVPADFRKLFLQPAQTDPLVEIIPLGHQPA